MLLFCQNMMEITAALAMNKPTYADMNLKFAAHYLWIARALMHAGENTGMWDEQDGFFYDVLRLPDGRAERLKVRSMVGLLPLCAVTVFDGKVLDRYPEIRQRYREFLLPRPELRAFIHDPVKLGHSGRRLSMDDPVPAGVRRVMPSDRAVTPRRAALSLVVSLRPRRAGVPALWRAAGVDRDDRGPRGHPRDARRARRVARAGRAAATGRGRGAHSPAVMLGD
jgi:hypothetical protein